MDLRERSRLAVCGLVAALGAYKVWCAVKASLRVRELQARATRKREERDRQRRGYLTDNAAPGHLPASAADLTALVPAAGPDDHAGMVLHPVTDLTATELTAAIRSGEVGPEAAMTALCLRAALAGEALQSNAEEMFPDAMKAAADLAEKLRATDDKRPLLGVPVSIKDNIHVQGFDSTCGAAARTFIPAPEDSVIVQMLREAGAIPFVKGNVPQQLMMPMSSNGVWGTAVLPWDHTRTPGGSSGGEGILVAVGAAPIAIGTDIGGSIRIPCSNNGVFGFKPTPQRMTHHGIPACRPKNSAGQEAILSTAGPIARCVADLVTVMRVLWKDKDNKMFSVDPFVVPMTFNEGKFGSSQRLRIGYYVHDGWMDAAPSYGRAVNMAVEHLTNQGHTVVPFTVPEPSEFLQVMYGLLSADGEMHGYIEGLEGEPLHPDYRDIYFLSKLPSFARTCLSKVLSLVGEQRLSIVTRVTNGKSTREYWEYMKRLQAFKQRFTDDMADAGIEALICPSGSLPALPHDATRKMTPSFSANFLYNVLHFPVGTVPITTVQPNEEIYCSRFSDRISKIASDSLRGASGLPVGVQVVGLPYQDETCLKVMLDLEGVTDSALLRPSQRLINGKTQTDKFFAEVAARYALSHAPGSQIQI